MASIAVILHSHWGSPVVESWYIILPRFPSDQSFVSSIFLPFTLSVVCIRVFQGDLVEYSQNLGRDVEGVRGELGALRDPTGSYGLLRHVDLMHQGLSFNLKPYSQISLLVGYSGPLTWHFPSLEISYPSLVASFMVFLKV